MLIACGLRDANNILTSYSVCILRWLNLECIILTFHWKDYCIIIIIIDILFTKWSIPRDSSGMQWWPFWTETLTSIWFWSRMIHKNDFISWIMHYGGFIPSSSPKSHFICRRVHFVILCILSTQSVVSATYMSGWYDPLVARGVDTWACRVRRPVCVFV